MTSHIARWASAAGLSLLIAGASWASPISSSLSIVGTVSLDTASANPFAHGGRNGTLRAVSGGVASTADFNSGLTFSSGSNPLVGNLTAVNDGIGARHAAGGGTNASTGVLGIDYSVSLHNTSATETFVVHFLADITNAVSATGRDAFAISKISIFNPGGDEVVYSDFRIDTVNTGPSNNFQATSGSNAFSITLAPGVNVSFTAGQSLEGGAFSDDAQFSLEMSAFLKVASVTSRGGPTNNVPLPGSLPLVMLGLGVLLAARRRALPA